MCVAIDHTLCRNYIIIITFILFSLLLLWFFLFLFLAMGQKVVVCLNRFCGQDSTWVIYDSFSYHFEGRLDMANVIVMEKMYK